MVLLAGGVILLPACGRDRGSQDGNDETLEAFADTLLPAGSSANDKTLGAKAAGAHLFARRMIRDCYPKDQQDRFMRGLGAFNQRARDQYGKPFASCNPAQQNALVSAINTLVASQSSAASGASNSADSSGSSGASKSSGSSDTSGASGSSAASNSSGPSDTSGASGSSGASKSSNTSGASGSSGASVASAGQKTEDLSFFFREAKGLVIQGYLGSQYFLTKIEVYELVPGRWHGCIPVTKKS